MSFVAGIIQDRPVLDVSLYAIAERFESFVSFASRTGPRIYATSECGAFPLALLSATYRVALILLRINLTTSCAPVFKPSSRSGLAIT